jgi:RHS repeat-associated protein
MTQYAQRRGGTWMDVPVLENTSGFYTRDFTSGARETQEVRILQAKSTDYDQRNRPIVETACLDTGPDPVTRYQYDGFGNRTNVTDPCGHATTTAYDSIYHVFPGTVTNALGQVEQYLVDPGHGLLLRHVDANGQVRTATYDALGRITSRTNGYGFTNITHDYGFFDTVSSTTVYLPNRIRTTVWAPDGGHPVGVWRERHYDGLGREYQALKVGQRGASDPIRQATEFNDRGIAWKVSHPHWVSETGGEHWSCTFLENDDLTLPSGPKEWKRPGLDRAVQVLRELTASGDVQTTATQFETPLSTKLTDGRGSERREIMDAFGNRVGVWEANELGSVGSPQEPQGRLTRYGYDGLGRLEFVRRHVDQDQYQAADPVTNVAYDTLGRRTRLSDPDSGVALYDYDAKGNLTRSIDARGMEVTRRYDALDRLERLIYPDVSAPGELEHVYTYDAGSGENLVGRLGRIRSPGCDIEYSYDPEGQPARIRQTIEGVAYQTTAQYDPAGRRTEMAYPDGMRLRYGYDPVTQALDTITDPDSGQVWLAGVAMGKFDVSERLTLGNGVTRTNEFDLVGRACRLLTTSGATALSDLRYTFDPNSNITRIQELAGPTPRGDMDYQYDSLDRLTAGWGVTMSGAGAGTQYDPVFGYGYDALGRMTRNNRFLNPAFGDSSLEYEYSANPSADRPAHGVRGIRFTKAAMPAVYAHRFEYDAAGNPLRSTNESAAVFGNDLNRTYTWDGLGRLASVAGGAGTTRFAYDHSDRRVKKTGPAGEAVVYVGDIMEVSSTGAAKHIFAGRKRIATIKTGSTTEGTKLFIMTDHLRSSTLITDAAGGVVQRMDYEPYGALIQNPRSGNGVAVRHTYAGKEADAETGLMYYGARYYDPIVGMFISADRLTRRSGEPQRYQWPDRLVSGETEPQAFNRFAYALNNPMVYVDETGEEPFTIFITTVIISTILATTAAAVTGGIAYSQGQIDTGQLMELIAIGFAAGALGGAAGGGIGAAGAAAGAAGFAAVGVGAMGGAIGGGITGFVGGFGYSAIKGESIGQALEEGWQTAIAGAAVGAAGGMFGGAATSGMSAAAKESTKLFVESAVSVASDLSFGGMQMGFEWLGGGP